MTSSTLVVEDGGAAPTASDIKLVRGHRVTIWQWGRDVR
jgi:hypothetical protein